MKRGTLFFLLLLLVSSSAWAETNTGGRYSSLRSGIDLFVSTWSTDGAIADIEYFDGHFQVQIEIADCGFERSTWVYSCNYDAEKHTLIASGTGKKTIFLFDEDLQAETEQVAYLDGNAVFAINADGRLTWLDERENTDHNLQFIKMGGFQGVWRCDNITITFSIIGGAYRCTITQVESPEDITEWSYFCNFDLPTEHAVSNSNGRREVLIARNEGEEEYKEIYRDGSAVFSIEDGCLIWNDAKDDAGKGLRFVRYGTD